MSKETKISPAPTESQQQFKRLLLKEYRPLSREGDGLKRFGLNAGIFTVSTGIDIAEGKLAEKAIEWVFEGSKVDVIEAKKESGSHALADKNPRIKGAVEFIEEWGSDGLINSGANALVRAITGEKHAEYASPFSEAVGEWTTTILQVFKGNPKWRGIAVKNLVSSVNVEAVLRMFSELPLLGGAVSWTHEQLDSLMRTRLVRVANTAAAKGILGYHIVNQNHIAAQKAVAEYIKTIHLK